MPSDRPLSGKRILMFVGDMYEDLELWYPKLRLIEAGATVTVAGEKAEAKYTGKNGYPCVSDAAIARMRASDFQGVVCPGGFRRGRQARRRNLSRRLDPDIRWRLSRCQGHRLSRHQGRSGERRRRVGRRVGGDRPPLRKQPQAGRSAGFLPGDLAGHGR
jgi:hypothetical protein